MKLKIISTGSQGNCYILENENEALIIEAGIKFIEVKKALDFNVNKIVGAIVSHNHGDHAKYTNEYLKSGIDVHATFGTFKALNINNITNHRVNTFHKNNDNWINRKIGNFIIKPFDINHDAAEPVGFLIHHPDCGITLFLTDTAYSDYTFKGLNNIIVECNYSEEIIEIKLTDKKEFLKNRIIGSHMSLETLIELLENNDLSKVNNIVLIHLSDSNSHAVNFQKTIAEKTLKNVIIAENNQEIDFNKTPF